MQIAFSFDAVSRSKIFKGAMISGGGAAILYALQYVSGLDFGSYTPIATAVFAALINMVKSYVEGVSVSS